jgi:hypothetical protein
MRDHRGWFGDREGEGVLMSRKSEGRLIDVAATMLHETPAAYRIFDGTKTEWVPKSQVEYNEEDGTFTMPEWLAKEKEFI